jgi:pyrroloquinoline quinone biosynthesis protein E
MLTQERTKLLPRPAPDKELFKATLEAGFREFPQRKENYLRYKANRRAEELDYLPVKMDIENVSRCNYRCNMCQVSDWPGSQRAADMTLADYQAFLEAQFGLIEIKLQGMGEPLLGECYFEMVAYARKRHIWVRSTSNGALLHVKDNYKKVIDADISEFQVSLDGATQETYLAIRRGGNLKRVKDNCLLLNKYCDTAGRRRTRMWVVVQKENFPELEKFVLLAAELGFKRLSFSLDLNDWGQARWKAANDRIDMHRQFNLGLAQRLIEAGKVKGVEVTFWFIDEKYDTRDINKLCPWPFERAFISSDMKIVPCCMVGNPAIAQLGDARNFTEEWNGPNFREFRNKHISGSLAGFCRSCYGL